MLRPKGDEDLGKVRDRGYTYDWCFPWAEGTKTVRKEAAASDTAGVMEQFRDHVGCKDFDDEFFCNNGEDGERKDCLSCFAAFQAIRMRGHFVQEGVKKSLQAGRPSVSGGEL